MAYRKENECFITYVTLKYKQHLTSWIQVKKYTLLGVKAPIFDHMYKFGQIIFLQF